ncbi:NUDIX hydrolase [Pseudomonas botevensis]|uniref:NUDIX hydrolase n=1 Tax=Pseudomonas botevensis TaxID=2842352 RepID=UPI001C3CBD4F|nr:NUDIX domain-containing protein [Pseudomonas botevensis]MBV4477619.1 NUDIX domain-containing protein [Pseudomonas botevensis]
MKIRATIVCEQNHQVLLVRKPKKPWNLPGGRLKSGETCAAAAVRELNEETGLSSDSLLYLMEWTSEGTKHHVFEVSVSNVDDAAPRNEICDCLWQPLDSIQNIEICKAALLILKSFQRRL